MFYRIFLVTWLIGYSFSKIGSKINDSNSLKFLRKTDLILYDKVTFLLSSELVYKFVTCGPSNLPLVMNNLTFSSKPAKGQQFNITLVLY